MESCLFISGSEAGDCTEVRELMASRHVDDQQLAIDALKGWCKTQEQITEPPEGKEYYDRHHWLNRKAGKGQPFASYRQLPENKTYLRRDIHERVERTFGWVTRPFKEEVMLILEPQAA
jgi:hypothetical protein